MDFRWDDCNLDVATKHGVTPDEAEHVVRFARRPYPQRRGADKYYVVGRGASDRYVEVVFLMGDDGEAYVIHAMPLDRKRRSHRRRRK